MKKEVILWLAIALVIAAFLSPFASPNPDGLEKVAEDKGFLKKAEGQEVIRSPLPDYLFPGIQNEAVATALAGALGTLATFGLMYGLGQLTKPRDKG